MFSDYSCRRSDFSLSAGAVRLHSSVRPAHVEEEKAAESHQRCHLRKRHQVLMAARTHGCKVRMSRMVVGNVNVACGAHLKHVRLGKSKSQVPVHHSGLESQADD